MQRFKTPIIPHWIRTLHCPGYTNIFELGLGNTNLFGTETLLGDWGGVLLVVAKDFAPYEEVNGLVVRSVNKSLIYRHNDGDGRYRTGYRTNSRLIKFIFGDGDGLLSGSRNLDCGALYVSACFLLKSGTDPSSSLKGWKPGSCVFEESKKVLRFVLDHMPRLKAIACLGGDAYSLVSSMRRIDLPAYQLLHPSRGSNAAHEEGRRYLMHSSSIRLRNGRLE